MPCDTTRDYTVLAITSFALLGSVLGKPFVRSQCLLPQGSHTESNLLCWITKPLPRNTATVSEETHLGVCKTTGVSKEQNWVFTRMPHADYILPLCAIIASDFESSELLQRRTLIPITGKAVLNISHALFYPSFVCCISSLCQEFLKSVLWLWHWGRQARQVLHTHTHSEQTRHPVFRNKQCKEIWEIHCSCQDI